MRARGSLMVPHRAGKSMRRGWLGSDIVMMRSARLRDEAAGAGRGTYRWWTRGGGWSSMSSIWTWGAGKVKEGLISGMGAGRPSEGSMAGIVPSARRGHEDVGRSGSWWRSGRRSRGRSVRRSKKFRRYYVLGRVQTCGVGAPLHSMAPRRHSNVTLTLAQLGLSRIQAQHQAGKCGRMRKR